MREFGSIGAFLRFLPGLALEVQAAEQRGRHAAADRVRREVVATLGEYQTSDTGPFAPWPDLAEETQERREKAGFAPDEPEFVTGALLDSISASVEGARAAVGVADETVGSGQPGDAIRNIGDVAVAQELGHDGVPARSFLGIGGFRAAESAAVAFVAPVIEVMAGSPPSNRRRGVA